MSRAGLMGICSAILRSGIAKTTRLPTANHAGRLQLAYRAVATRLKMAAVSRIAARMTELLMSALDGKRTLRALVFRANDWKEEHRWQNDEKCPAQSDINECQRDCRRICRNRDPDLSEHPTVNGPVELIDGYPGCMASQQCERASAHHYDKRISSRCSWRRRVQPEETGDDRYHRNPEEHMIIEPQRSAVDVGQREDQIMMVGPEDPHHDEC